jgi:GNAT superfamily N-acetyltransferase
LNSKAVNFLSGGEELLPEVEDLWLKLKDFHIENFSTWSESLRGGNFTDRVSGLKESAQNGALLVEIAQVEGLNIAFCISVIDKVGAGELASLFVDQEHRQQGIALRFVQRSLQWLKEHKAVPIYIDVMAGNVAALKLYEKEGFVQRVHRLEWVE